MLPFARGWPRTGRQRWTGDPWPERADSPARLLGVSRILGIGTVELDDLIQGWIAATAVAERERRVAAIVGAAAVVAVRAARMNGISDEDAEDVAQHTCAKLVQHLSNGGRFTTSASAFVWRVAENRARDLHRSRKRTSEGNARLLAEVEVEQASAADPRARWADAERQRFVVGIVRDALLVAPENYRTVIQRHYIDGEPIEDLAETYYRRKVDAGEVDVTDPRAVGIARKKARDLVDQHLKRGRDWLQKRILAAMEGEGN